MTIGDRSLTLPVVQGGMGIGVSMARLAAAVAEEGGVGVIAGAMIGMREPDISTNPLGATVRALRSELRKARAATAGMIGVNIMTALAAFAPLAKTALEEGADAIFSGAGLPTDLPGILLAAREELGRDVRTSLIPIVSSARAASVIARKWAQKYACAPDAFVVEGPMAGGHLGFAKEDLGKSEFALETLLPQVLEAVKPFEDKAGRRIPVIAAGGIFSGGDIGRFLELGAAGVQMGTRFVATRECDADERFKQAFVNARREDVTIIDSPVGMPGRALRNVFVDPAEEGGRGKFRCAYHCVKSCHQGESPYCIASALVNAVEGELDRGVVFCGENVFRVDGVYSVRDLVGALQREYGEWRR